MDLLWVILSAVGCLTIRLGYALHEAGLVRSKNSSGMILRSTADLCLATLTFWAAGAAIMLVRHDQGAFSINSLALLGRSPSVGLELLLYLSATLVASGIVPGVVGERSRFWPTAALSILVALLVVPLGGRLAWSGRFPQFHDFGGSAVLHVSAATVALVASRFIGPRQGKYNRDGSANAIPGHSVPLASIGVLVIFLGFVPFLVGMSITQGVAASSTVTLNAILAAAAGAVASLLLCQFRYGKPDIHLTYAGLLGGLVAVSGSADRIAPYSAVLIGLVAGVLVPIATLTIDLLFRTDDPSNAIAVHGVAGAWGTLAVAIFSSGLTLAQRLKALGAQLVGLLVLIALAAALTAGLLYILGRLTPLRSKEADEFDGLDLAEHDIGSYPDFQQTTIKSYHLREA